MPVQRLPRYEMLLRDIVKHTWDSHPDKSNLTEALRHICEINAFVNESKRAADNCEKVVDIRSKLNNCSFEVCKKSASNETLHSIELVIYIYISLFFI